MRDIGQPADSSIFPTEYAQVLKMLGNGRVEAMCFDGEKRLAHIRGKMRKKVGHLHSIGHVGCSDCMGRGLVFGGQEIGQREVGAEGRSFVLQRCRSGQR